MNLNEQLGRAPFRQQLAIVAAAAAVTALALLSLGQPFWCDSGDLAPWSSAINSSHNSQHLADPYTLTHVLHGILLYGALWAAVGTRLSTMSRFAVAMGFEAAWEILENTAFIIERYRVGTVSLDYYGDSMFNSLGDLLACALGFGVAAALPVWGSAVAVVAVEIVLLIWIRDSLLLNVVMLVRPFESIRDWQLGG